MPPALPRLLPLILFLALAFSSASADAQRDPVEKKLTEHMTQTWQAQGKSKYFEAARRAKKWVAYAKRKRGPTHPDTLTAMQAQATIAMLTGGARKAEPLLRRIVEIRERTDPGSIATAGAIDSLASNYWTQQRLDEAESLFSKTLKIYEKHWGRTDMFAGMLGRQAAFMQARYMFGAAEQLYHEQAKLYRKTDPKSDQALSVHMSLGMLYGRQGDFKRGRKSLDKLIRGYEKKYGKDDTTRLPAMIQTVASMYFYWGKTRWAKPLNERAEKLYRAELRRLRADKKTHPGMIFNAQYQLATILDRQGKLNEALDLWRKILANQRAQYGKTSIQASTAIYPIVQLHIKRGEVGKARKQLKELARINKKAYGTYNSTPDVLLSDLERTAGNFKEAKRLAKKVRASYIKQFGKTSLHVRRYDEMIALLDLGLGKPKSALKLLTKAYADEKKAIALMMASGTENDNRTYLSERRHQLHVAVTLHSQYLPKNKKAIRLGLDTVLVLKGRLLDASAASVGSLRKQLSKKDQKLLDELAAARSELAQLVIAGPKVTGGDEEAYGKEIARLERLVRKLEGKVRNRSAVFRAREQPIEIKKIQKAIPSSASLVEIVAYRRVDPKAKGVAPKNGDRYGAYVLGRKGEPKFVDLGPSKRIDRAVGKLRRELSSAAGSDYEKYGKQLYNLVFAKIEPLLGKRKLVLLAPDGALNVLPFAALIDGRGKFLVRRYSFSYLSSGRDLLRLAVKINPKGGPVIFADPTFDDGGQKPGKKGTRGLTARALRSIKWKKLPGTAREAKAIVKLIDDAKLFDGKRATESTLKRVAAPRILHLATHGFFLPDKKTAPEPEPSNAMTPPTVAAATPSLGSGQDNPLLRSGLALAGANKLASGREDGVLTALEASGLNLWGTKLVVLSACETGIGKISPGEGVYGLRRALVMAGAESMLMSLWQVDDFATKDLMTGYYKRLGKGKGRAEALRLIQLKMLESEKHDHPYYWASFIPSGAWTAMK